MEGLVSFGSRWFGLRGAKMEISSLGQWCVSFGVRGTLFGYFCVYDIGYFRRLFGLPPPSPGSTWWLLLCLGGGVFFLGLCIGEDDIAE